MKRILCICLLIIISITGIFFYYKDSLNQINTIYVALVGPMTGKNAMIGGSFVQGCQLYFNELNNKKDQNFRVVLDIYDDQNNAKEAVKQAMEIANANKYVAVIGHHYSSCSISAGLIYKQNGIPAITPASTNIQVTENNEWYFRTCFNDTLQSRFLAIYVKEILQKNEVSIISENLQYGAYLAQVFEKKSKELGIQIKNKWEFDVEDQNLDQSIESIVNDLQTKDNAEVLFLATHGGEGSKILKLMKDQKISKLVVTPDAFASQAFQSSFNIYPETKDCPGFYTNGIYVTTPLIFDTTSEKGQSFKNAYYKQFGEEPGWHAAFAYDSAMVIYQAITNNHIMGNVDTIKNDRILIRDWLTKLNKMDTAIEGATGLNYFNENGDAQKPVSIGLYKNNSIISALIQLQDVNDLSELSNIDESIESKNVLFTENKYMYKTNVVYTGIRIIEIKELNLRELSSVIDFYIWFRFKGQIAPENIEFQNEIEPITLGEPIEKKEKNGIHYRLYRVKGVFKTDFLSDVLPFGKHLIGISFQHKALTRNNLIFVVDVLGMGLSEGVSSADQLNQAKVLSPVSGWSIDEVTYFQDIAEESSLGRIEYLDMKKGVAKYSRFNMGILIKRNTVNIRNKVLQNYDYRILVILIILFSILVFCNRKGLLDAIANTAWSIQTILVFCLLLYIEGLLLNSFYGRTTLENTYLIKKLFDILWWVIPAYCLNLVINRFIWIPLEEKTKRTIPSVAKRFIAFIILLIAFFCIIAFVFGERITGLLATSGVAAMILGLAVQMNLSNIFSGIALNMERPFRTGDWIKIGSMEKEGKVQDVSWRTTRIQLRDYSYICIPNSLVCESIIQTFSYPNDIIENHIKINVDPFYAPNRVIKIMNDALLSVDKILKYPKAFARFKGMTDWSSMYSIFYCIDDYSKKMAIEEIVWRRVRAHLRRAGISLALQKHKILLSNENETEDIELADNYNLLNDIEIFKPFPDEAKSIISEKLRNLHFREDEIIVSQGDKGDSLFIIIEGVVNIRLQLEDGNIVEIARLGAGNFFGEMSLLTGEPRTATVITLTETYLFEIKKDDIAPIMEMHPEISTLLGEVLMDRKIKNEALMDKVSYSAHEIKDESNRIVSRILNYFGISAKVKNDREQ